MSCEAVATFAWIWFDATVDFGMSLEIVLADETFLAMKTLKLAISEVRLHVGLDIFFAPETFVALRVETQPLAVSGVWTRYKGSNIVDCNAGIRDRLFKVDARHRLGSSVW